ncbi:MAG: response regulator [Verrucomicrobiales bacterium]
MSIPTKILLVDDEEDFTELLAENLQEAGNYELKQVNNPTQALSVARDFVPDICVIDLVMPQMDGGDVVSALRGDPALAQTPVLMLTALVEEDPAQPGKAQMKGGLPFVSKTSDLWVIQKAIEEALGR